MRVCQLYDQTRELAIWYWNLANQYGPTEKRLFAGRMVGEMLTLMNNITQYQPTPAPGNNPDGDTPLPRFLQYSAHDTTVMPLLVAFESFDGTPPPYAAHVGRVSRIHFLIVLSKPNRCTRLFSVFDCLVQWSSCARTPPVITTCAPRTTTSHFCCHSATLKW